MTKLFGIAADRFYWNQKDLSPYHHNIVDFRSAEEFHTITGRLQIQKRASRQISRVARVFFP